MLVRNRLQQLSWADRSYAATSKPSWKLLASSSSKGKSAGFATQSNDVEPPTGLQVTDPLLLYRGMIAEGKVKMDGEQIRALLQIRKVTESLLDYQPPIRLLTLLEALRPSTDPNANQIPHWPFKRSSMSNLGMHLLPSEEAERQEILQMNERTKSKALVTVLKDAEGLESLDTPRGFLLTGPPGTGKSLLMDIFFQSLPVPHKIRFHYHHFLLSIYSKVHEALEQQRLVFEAEELAMNEAAGIDGEDGYPWSRKEEMKALALTKGWRAVFAGGRSPNDPDLNTKEFVLATVARDLITTHGWLLAFDEVQLVDIAGAGLLNRVLSWYWRLGGVVVGTSNRVPEDLYNSGGQRESINSFLVALASRSPVIELQSSLDYRREQRGSETGFIDAQDPGDFGEVGAWKRFGTAAKGWFVKGQEEDFKAAASRLIGDQQFKPAELKVYGRTLHVPRSVGGIARFTFHELCEKALGPADYITIASTYHTIIIDDIPVLMLNAKNEARRLITLLDALYESKTRLLAFAQVDVDSLFFPDAISANGLSSSELESPTDDSRAIGTSLPLHAAEDLTEGDSASIPPHSPLRHAVDPSGEIGDSLTEEMMGDLKLDLEQPYRPNISSYDASGTTSAFSKDAARIDQDPPKQYQSNQSSSTRPKPHPSASTPSFQSLAIFTGEEERFAFKRAVSRVHEMSSPEFLLKAEWTPMNASFRTWERPANISPSRSTVTPAKHTIGEAQPLDETKLSGVLSPSDLRAKYPEGMPKHSKEVEIDRPAKAKRPAKKDVNVEDPRRDTEPPVHRVHHVWGVREDWGEGAGPWGKGASAFEDNRGKKS